MRPVVHPEVLGAHAQHYPQSQGSEEAGPERGQQPPFSCWLGQTVLSAVGPGTEAEPKKTKAPEIT